jgi:hypothetical protein
VVLRPDGQYLLLPALDAKAVRPHALALVERLLPPTAKRSVAMIGDLAWTIGSTPNLKAANEAIPFFGLLMGFTSMGHAVWIFDTNAISVLSEAAREDI